MDVAIIISINNNNHIRFFSLIVIIKILGYDLIFMTVIAMIPFMLMLLIMIMLILIFF